MGKTAKLELEIDSVLQARFMKAASAIDADPRDVIADLMREFVDEQEVEEQEPEEGYWEFVAAKVAKARASLRETDLDGETVEAMFAEKRRALAGGQR